MNVEFLEVDAILDENGEIEMEGEPISVISFEATELSPEQVNALMTTWESAFELFPNGRVQQRLSNCPHWSIPLTPENVQQLIQDTEQKHVR